MVPDGSTGSLWSLVSRNSLREPPCMRLAPSRFNHFQALAPLFRASTAGRFHVFDTARSEVTYFSSSTSRPKMDFSQPDLQVMARDTYKRQRPDELHPRLPCFDPFFHVGVWP